MATGLRNASARQGTSSPARETRALPEFR